MAIPRYKSYLEDHRVVGSVYTHTQFGDKRGSFHIPNVVEFLPIYYAAVVESGYNETLTERQHLNEFGPLGIDLDFKYVNMDSPRYSQSDVLGFIDLLLFELLKLMTIEHEFPIHVFEKTEKNTNSKTETKDGIHIIVCVNMSVPQKKLLYKHVVDALQPQLKTEGGCFSTLEITPASNASTIVDFAVFGGTNNWMMYGSMKKGCPPYLLTQSFLVKDPMTSHFSVHNIDFDVRANFDQLSIQYSKYEPAVVKAMYAADMSAGTRKRTRIPADAVIDPMGSYDTLEQIQADVDKLMVRCRTQTHEHNVIDAYAYVMCLPESL
jgi:hypothetical protein